MDGVMRLGRGFVLLPLAALIGCGPPDYTPVRDWAGVAGNAALYPELVTRPGSTPAPVPAAASDADPLGVSATPSSARLSPT